MSDAYEREQYVQSLREKPLGQPSGQLDFASLACLATRIVTDTLLPGRTMRF